MPEHLTWLPIVIGAAALATPFVIGIGRCTAALARLLAASALPAAQNSADLAEAPRRALVVTLEMAIVLVVAAPVVASTQPFLPRLPAAAVLAGVVLLFLVALWRSAANLQAHARAGAQAFVEVLARQLRPDGEGETADVDDLHRLLPGLGTPAPIRIEAGSEAVGRTLAEINLRSLTGATVLAIVRQGDSVLTPTGREKLQAGDVLAVAGTAAAVKSARERLSGASSPA